MNNSQYKKHIVDQHNKLYERNAEYNLALEIMRTEGLEYRTKEIPIRA